MADEESKQQKVHPFDQMMFGPKANRPSKQKDEPVKESDNDDSIDLFGTAQTMMETYGQLSPYVKSISNMFKSFKS
ncbi:hypothetical protein [Radiobacillus sp. PE A8.2]|uniref:hypothetical protein n=1 Tax=Radiobacillus sp. PE A8.2 TaxID=3380349 RepID=UPI00388E1144